MYRKVRVEVQQKVEGQRVDCGSQLALDGLRLLKIMATSGPVFQAAWPSLRAYSPFEASRSMKRKNQSARRRGFHLTIEALDHRQLLSGIAFAPVAGTGQHARNQ